jgi:hypothetical protein
LDRCVFGPFKAIQRAVYHRWTLAHEAERLDGPTFAAQIVHAWRSLPQSVFDAAWSCYRE